MNGKQIVKQYVLAVLIIGCWSAVGHGVMLCCLNLLRYPQKVTYTIIHQECALECNRHGV